MESYYRKDQHPTFIISGSSINSTSPTAATRLLEELSSDRVDAIVPETVMQPGMRKASETWRNSDDEAEPRNMIDRSKLVMLEDHFTVIQKRNVVLITENESLRSRLKESSDAIRELRESSKNFNLEISSSETRQKKKKLEDRGVATADFLETMERGIQAWAVCRWCEGKFEDRKSVEATAIMTKSELERLEKDVRRLKDAVATRESDWDGAIERENCYREQFKRLAAESMTSRQLLESRHDELERLAQTLAETESDLRSARKEIFGLKKIIVRQRQSREPDYRCTDHHRVNESSEINDKELRWIDDIVKQLSNAKNIPKSKLVKDKAVMYASVTNSNGNQRSSPRAAAGKNIDRPALEATSGGLSSKF